MTLVQRALHRTILSVGSATEAYAIADRITSIAVRHPEHRYVADLDLAALTAWLRGNQDAKTIRGGSDV